jgi:hypothetical protein
MEGIRVAARYPGAVSGTEKPLAMTEKPPAIDISVAHPARIYDYWLGGKDNISQVVPDCPHSDRTPVIQARHAVFSNTDVMAVRGLSCTSMGVMSDFSDGRS